jgi:hypothetical protein
MANNYEGQIIKDGTQLVRTIFETSDGTVFLG